MSSTKKNANQLRQCSAGFGGLHWFGQAAVFMASTLTDTCRAKWPLDDRHEQLETRYPCHISNTKFGMNDFNIFQDDMFPQKNWHIFFTSFFVMEPPVAVRVSSFGPQKTRSREDLGVKCLQPVVTYSFTSDLKLETIF